MHYLTARGKWVVELPALQGLGAAGCRSYTANCPPQCNSCNTLPHCLGAVGRATPATRCHTAWGPWAVQLLQCTASLLDAVDNGTLAMHATPPGRSG